MKKTYLNTAVTMALTSAIISTTVFSIPAYADAGATTTTSTDNTNNAHTSENYLYHGLGAGAATGALVAGPVGLLVGGIAGAIFGSSQARNTDEDKLNKNISLADNSLNTTDIIITENISSNEDTSFLNQSPETVSIDSSMQSNKINHLQVAQSGPINSVIDNSTDLQQKELLNILTTELSLDIYFRSGSTSIESFYPARLSAIADLMNNLTQLELHLDGYTDRRGNKEQNIALANQRIEKVRQQLIDSGVNENRIFSKAFGEIKMVSDAGDLDAYTFDRKVVIRFERSQADSIYSMTETLSVLETVTGAEIEMSTAAVSEVDISKADDAAKNIVTAAKEPVVADASTRF